MASVRRRLNRIEVGLDSRERALLVEIVDELKTQVGRTPRTAPRAYDEPDLETEYSRYVLPSVALTRDGDIAALRDALAASRDRDALRLDDERALAWVRALNHLRLTAADRLGIEGDEWERDAPAQMRTRDDYGMLMALTWLQDGIVGLMEG